MDITTSPSSEVISTCQFYRHPITTYWLGTVAMINVLFGVFQLVTFFFSGSDPFPRAAMALAAFSIAAGAFLLLQWKKLGFYLVYGGYAVHVALHMITGDPFVFVRGLTNMLISLGLLYAVLQIGNENKPWNQLK